MTFLEVFNSYLVHLSVRSKASTQKVAASHCQRLATYFGTNPADQLSRARVDAFVVRERERGLTDPSINGILRTLRAALNLAGLGHPVKLLTETRKIPSILTADDVRELMIQAPGTDERLAIALAAYAGLRHGEIAHLTWTDLDMTERFVRVTAKPGWTPKAHCEREMPMNAQLIDAIRVHETLIGRSKPLFAISDFTSGVKAAFVLAGLYIEGTKPGLHMLRRTFASRLLQTGTDIETVRELGGWSDLATVQRYVASTTGLKRAAVDRL